MDKVTVFIIIITIKIYLQILKPIALLLCLLVMVIFNANEDCNSTWHLRLLPQSSDLTEWEIEV